MRNVAAYSRAWFDLRVWLRMGAEAEVDEFGEVAQLAQIRGVRPECAVEQAGERLCAM